MADFSNEYAGNDIALWLILAMKMQGMEPANLMTNTLHIGLQSVVDYFIHSMSCT